MWSRSELLVFGARTLAHLFSSGFSCLSQQLDAVPDCLQQKSCKSVSSESFFCSFPAPILPVQKWTQGGMFQFPCWVMCLPLTPCPESLGNFYFPKLTYQKQFGRVWLGEEKPVTWSQKHTSLCEWILNLREEGAKSFGNIAVHTKSGMEMRNHPKHNLH